MYVYIKKFIYKNEQNSGNSVHDFWLSSFHTQLLHCSLLEIFTAAAAAAATITAIKAAVFRASINITCVVVVPVVEVILVLRVVQVVFRVGGMHLGEPKPLTLLLERAGVVQQQGHQKSGSSYPKQRLRCC